MTADLAVHPRCLICEGYGYIGIWRTYWVTMRRCPFCQMRERQRLDWILASHARPA